MSPFPGKPSCDRGTPLTSGSPPYPTARHSLAAATVLVAMGSLLAMSRAASAQDLPARVESATDGTGWFTDTFGRGDTPHVWGLDPQTGDGSSFLSNRRTAGASSA